MTLSLLVAVLLFLAVALSLLTVAYLRRVRRRQDAIRHQARQKMLDHWACQELNGRTLMLDGESLRRAWRQLR